MTRRDWLSERSGRGVARGIAQSSDRRRSTSMRLAAEDEGGERTV